MPLNVAVDGTDLVHEQIVLRRGERSGATLVIAVHSTALGAAVGGCRMSDYPSWRDGLADALRLSEAMSLKCAAADLDLGGGKAVIALPDGTVLSSARREDVMFDLGDLVESLGGRYITGPDVGTHAADLARIRQRTTWAARLEDGTPAPTDPTAIGVHEAIRATARDTFARDTLEGLRITVVGLGSVGLPLIESLVAEGAVVSATDVLDAKRSVAEAIGARWLAPERAITAEADILAPCGLGGTFTPGVVPTLRCRAIAGAANNQLSDPAVADLMARRGIVWAPDFVVNAGGVVYGTRTDLDGVSGKDALADVRAIGPRLSDILAGARAAETTPLAVAVGLARARLAAAGDRRPSTATT